MGRVLHCILALHVSSTVLVLQKPLALQQGVSAANACIPAACTDCDHACVPLLAALLQAGYGAGAYPPPGGAPPSVGQKRDFATVVSLSTWQP
jgi:hypothetical protein